MEGRGGGGRAGMEGGVVGLGWMEGGGRAGGGKGGW